MNRLSSLIRTGAISQQDYEDAVSAADQSKATVAEARATLERRKLDLAYATVKTPIGGRVDQNFITEGALVSAGDTQALATVQQIDKVYVDVRQPAAQQNFWHQDMTTSPEWRTRYRRRSSRLTESPSVIKQKSSLPGSAWMQVPAMS